MNDEVQQLELQISELIQRLAQRRRETAATAVANYPFRTLAGEVRLADLFAGRDTLFAIHNMGQGCRYCTLWADGLNGFLPHLEDRFSVVLLSRDEPEVQQRFAHSRNWRFRMASHGGGDYIREQSVSPGGQNVPGLVCYQREADRIFCKGATAFGPGDLYCPIWHVLGLAGICADDWTPQYNYWQRPAAKAMEDGGQNLR